MFFVNHSGKTEFIANIFVVDDAQEIATVSQSSSEMSTSSSEVQASTSELSETAEKLKDMVGGFKL